MININILNIFSFFCAKRTVVAFCILLNWQSASAQAWMQGYNFRKKITINKSGIAGASNLLKFNVLLELDLAGLQDKLGCGDGLKAGILPISFASDRQPNIPIPFQADHYDVVSGKLHCWVQIAELITASNAGTNAVYFYYGGKNRHDPMAEESRAIWLEGYSQVWHMNLDAGPAISYSAGHRNGNHLYGSSGMNATHFVGGAIGSSTFFDGHSDYMRSAAGRERICYISGWVKLTAPGKDQVILAHDSISDGYRLKINAAGKLVFDLINFAGVSSHASTVAVPVNSWAHLTVIFINNQKKIYINGVYRGGGTSPSSVTGTSETISIGRSKQQDNYFNGLIDELRIGVTEKSQEWILTEYRNQLNPGTFIIVSAEEVNPVQTSGTNEFTGAGGTGNWTDEANWSHGQLPGKYTDVLIPSGKEVHINAGNVVALNGLNLGQGAIIVLRGSLSVNCTAQMAVSSSIFLRDNARLAFKNDLLNAGNIVSGQKEGTLSFDGNQPLQTVSGTGIITVAELEVAQALPSARLLLQSKVNVSKQLSLLNGILDANGYLTLLANGANDYAVVRTIDHEANTSVTGKVNVQQFIDGDFSNPSTARGWRLLSSPLFHTENGDKEYNLDAIKQNVFVTGPGGISNGFDASPNNNATIYTHNQALPGTLAQKYAGIQSMGARILLGKGFYVFSRGSRFEPNAYEHQVRIPPFSNPKPYILTHTGRLFTGELKIDVFNSLAGTAGDGYNLLGNPYAAPIVWGKLEKINVLPFIWIFDPKNNAYQVTDDPAYVIQAGTGFFVKVNHESGAGAVVFTEGAKSTVTSEMAFDKTVAIGKPVQLNENTKTVITVSLKKEDLSDEYVVNLRTSGRNELTDADAEKIGEGYLSIAGLTASGHKMAIEERKSDTSTHTIPLFVKGWANGIYALNLKMSLENDRQVTLLDHYLNKQIPVVPGESLYTFTIDAEKKTTFGKDRFSLIIRPLEKTNPINTKLDKAVLFYPNPVDDVLYFRSTDQTWTNLSVLVRTITGRVILRWELPSLETTRSVPFSCSQLPGGLYLLQLIDPKTNKTIASFKVLKN